ncbi:MAG TPA: Hsp20/alpha crystallin family protein [Bacteroidia bacterium]|nr:Hsp20/alpha crystallin family protein [Bacteroidia bacterium]
MNNFSKWAPQRSAFSHPFFTNTLPSLLDEAFSGKEFATFVPSVNIAEDEKNWHIEVSAAGFNKEDFKIKLENDSLVVSAEHKEENVVEEKKYSRREFRQGSFSRSFRLPKGKANEEAINATYENGILKLSIPKKEIEQKEQTKEIKIS